MDPDPVLFPHISLRAMDAVWQAFQNTVGGDATLSRAEMEGSIHLGVQFWDICFLQKKTKREHVTL